MALFGKRRGTMRSSYERGHPFLAGESVTGGEFVCARCGYRLRKETGAVTNLPVCPRCQSDRWKQG